MKQCPIDGRWHPHGHTSDEVSDFMRSFQWQPIETAPKDRYILVYAPFNIHSIITKDYTIHQVVMAHWSKDYDAFTVFGTYREAPDEYSKPDITIVHNPTHWMLLPEPPKEKDF